MWFLNSLKQKKILNLGLSSWTSLRAQLSSCLDVSAIFKGNEPSLLQYSLITWDRKCS